MTVLHVVLQLQTSVIFGPHLVSGAQPYHQENILKVEIFQHLRTEIIISRHLNVEIAAGLIAKNRPGMF